jgi:acetyltransferase-like isoleucine patch superfamily enzyme
MTENHLNHQNFSDYEEAFSSFQKRSLKRLKKEPYLLLPGFYAYLRGIYYRIKFRIFMKKVHIGKHFRVYGRLIITGPGSVNFGDDCILTSNVTKTIRIKTQLPDSKIIIGDHVGLNGTSIVCCDRIDINDFAHIADAYITDTSSHAVSRDRRLYAPPDLKANKVVIGKNVWISVSVVILNGVRIGDNTVVGACSLVRNDLPANVLAAGIPAKVIRQIAETNSMENY